MTANEIRQAGIDALVRELGPAGMIRFMQQFDKGSGDYTAERHRWLTQPSVEAVVADIEKWRRTKS